MGNKYEKKCAVNRFTAWLLISVILLTSADVTGLALIWGKNSSNWDVAYSLSTASNAGELLIGDETGRIIFFTEEDETVYFTMQLLDTDGQTEKRFHDVFTITMPTDIYQALEAENGDPDTWFPILEYVAEKASDADSRVATAANSKASSADADTDIKKLSFRFCEELRLNPDPEAAELTDDTFVISFSAPKAMTLMLNQTNQDCEITASEPPEMLPMNSNTDGLSMRLSIATGTSTDKEYKEEAGLISEKFSTQHVVTLRITYTIENHQEYDAGDFKISLNDLEAVLSEATAKASELTVNTHTPICRVSSDGWDYFHDTENGEIIFSNSQDLKADQAYQGYFEVQWSFFGSVQDIDMEFQASLETGELIMDSNVCTLTVEKTEKSTNAVRKSVISVPKSDIVWLPENYEEYFWVRYSLNAITYSQAILFAEYNITDQFADESCLVLDASFNEVTLNENREYVQSGVIRTNGTTSITGAPNGMTHLNVGYPKKSEKYPDGYETGDIVSNEVVYSARYEDMDPEDPDSWSVKKATASLQLVDFDFNYDGKLYSINKTSQRSTSVYEASRDENANVDSSNGYFLIEGTAYYTGKPMDVVFGDDLLYISRTDGTTTRLADDEYRFTQLLIPSFKTDTGQVLSGFRYTLEICKSGMGDGEYVVFQEGVLTDREQNITFNINDNVVAWQLTLHDVDKSLATGTMMVHLDVFGRNVDAGYLHNFDYLKVYVDGILKNRVSYDNYSNFITKEEIASFDQEVYKTYLQRATSSIKINKFENPVNYVYKTHSVDKSAPEGKSYVTWQVYDTISRSVDGAAANRLNRIVLHDIFPEGVTLREDVASPIQLDYDKLPTYIVLKDGRILSGAARYTYLTERTLIDVEHNYQNTGRMKMTITLDLTDNPALLARTSQMTTNTSNIRWLGAKIYTEISDEDMMRAGGKIRNYVYGEALSDLENGIIVGNPVADTGHYESAAEDINKNGVTEDEMLSYYPSVYTKSFPTSSIQTLKKYVRTSYTNGQFVSPYATAGVGEVYTYRLWVTNGRNYLGSLIFYDKIEWAVDADQNTLISDWYGTVNSFDTRRAAELGFEPKIWYYDQELPAGDNPPSLTDEPNVWKEYNDSVDKSDIKSVAFDLRMDKNGQPAKLEPDTELWIDIEMNAPAEYYPDYAKNSFWTEWEQMDAAGNGTGQLTGLTSNPVMTDLIDRVDIRVNLNLFKLDDNGELITGNPAVFGVYYDNTVNPEPVLDDQDNAVEFSTGVTGNGDAAFVLDPYKIRNDGQNNYYMLYVKELQAPAGFYDLGGTYEQPDNKYVMKIKIIPSTANDGTYSVSAFAPNTMFYSLLLNKVTGNIELRVNNFEKRARLMMNAEKKFIDTDGSERKLRADEFTFEAVLLAAEQADITMEGEPVTIGDVVAAANTADGNIKFPVVTVNRTGDYIFKLVEVNDEKAAVTYDKTVYYVHFNVYQDMTTGEYKPVTTYYGPYEKDLENISADTLKTETPLKEYVPGFVNKLEPGELRLEGKKELLRGTLKEDQFEFKLTYDTGDHQLVIVNEDGGSNTLLSASEELTITHDSQGVLRFPLMRFNKTGEYTFLLKEIAGNKDYINYSDVVYRIAVTVGTDEKTGLPLEPEVLIYAGSSEQPSNVILFINEIRPQAETLQAEKQMIGRPLKGNEFTFGAEFISSSVDFIAGDIMYRQGSGDYVQLSKGDVITAANHQGGEIIFGDIRFKRAGTYIFKLAEVVSDDETVLYDDTVYYAQFTVLMDADSGALNVSVVYGDEYDEQTRTVRNTSDGQNEAVFVNQEIERLRIYKISTENDRILPGAGFDLSFRRQNSDEEWIAYGETIYTAGADGSVSTELPENYWEYEYRLSERHVPDGHTDSAGSITFTVSKGGLITGLSNDGTPGHVSLTGDQKGLIIKNQRSEVPLINKVSIIIRKVSASAGTALRGARFTLHYREAGSSDDWQLLAGELVTAGMDGSVLIELPDHYWTYEYKLEETEAPTGYSKSRVGIITFVIIEQSGRIDDMIHTGTSGYVVLTDDGRGITVKNHTSGSGGGTNQPDPVIPSPPTSPGGPDSNHSDSSTTIDEYNTPLGKLTEFIEETVIPLSGLVKTGDNGNGVLPVVLMLSAFGFVAAVYRRKIRK